MKFSKEEIANMLGNSSRIQADMTTEAICDNPESYSNLIELTFDDNGQMAMRAARVVEICEGYFPDMFTPFENHVLKFRTQ